MITTPSYSFHVILIVTLFGHVILFENEEIVERVDAPGSDSPYGFMVNDVVEESLDHRSKRTTEDDIKQTANAHRRSKREADGVVGEAEAQAMLDKHNEYRAMEGSSDMQKMTWNNKLAEQANMWVKQCNWKHGFPTHDTGFNIVGQNLFMVNGATYDVERAVFAWYDEKSSFSYDENKCVGPKVCGHYTQVVWASTKEVGCAYKFCSSMKNSASKNVHLIGCNYGPAGNIQGVKPFKKGEACTQCAEGIGECQDDLCYVCSKRGGEDCECGVKCYNCGNVNKASCTCDCPVGLRGPFCIDPCQNERSECTSWGEHQCTNPKYAVVEKNCHAMCGTCVEGSPPTEVCEARTDRYSIKAKGGTSRVTGGTTVFIASFLVAGMFL